MKLQEATKAIGNYLAEKEKAEKARKGIFWLNPVFSAAYDGRYKTTIDGKEYRVGLIGFDGWPSEGYDVQSEGEHLVIKNEELNLD